MAWKKRFLIVCVFGLTLSPGLIALDSPKPTQQPPPLNKATSQSGVFIAFSDDRETRKKMLHAADEALEKWKEIYTTKAGAASPIILNDKTLSVAPKGAGAFLPLIFETETGMKVQIDLYEESALRSGVFENGVFTALALHAMHIDNPPRAGASLAMPPQWFIEGLAEELRRERAGTPDGIYSSLIQSGRPPDLATFFRQKPEFLDAGSIILYRAQALALMKVLQKSASAKTCFGALLSNDTFSNGGMDVILSAFPSLSASGQLSKLWTLNLARDSMPPRIASLSVEQSENALVEILKSVSASQPLQETAKGRGGAFLMNECAVRLFNLQFRAHPLYQPLVEEYRKLATLLARKPKTAVTKQLGELERARTALVERSQKITDYLNWFEVTQLDDSDFLHDSPPEHTTQSLHTNPYALYLDSLESRGW